MLHLHDSRTRRLEEVEPARRGLLRLCVCGAAAHRPQLDNLRLLLLADLVRRLAGRHRLRVIACPHDTDYGSFPDRTTLAGLNLHPLPETRDDGEADIAVRHRKAAGQPGGEARYLVDVADAEGDTGAVMRLLATGDTDPLTLRLALLKHPYREPVSIHTEGTKDTGDTGDTGDPAGAGATLARWRARVAGWAESPSQSMPDDHAGEVTRALEDDLDTPASLEALTRLEEAPEVTSGAKFEAFAHLDQLLGLDLASDIGKPR